MALFGGLFGTGVIEGLATGISERLDEDVKRTFERADRAADYHVRRKAADEERYQEEMREVEKLLNAFSKFTGGDIDKAAQLYKTGGGTVETSSAFYNVLNEAQMKLGDSFNINEAITFSESKAGEAGVRDYLSNLVRRPTEFISETLPESTTSGVGLYKMFKPQEAIKKDIREQVEGAIPTRKEEFRKFDIGTAEVDYGKLPMAKEYSRSQQLADLQLENAILQNQKLDAETAATGLMDGAAFTRAFDRVLKSNLNAVGGVYDAETGQLKISTAKGEYEKSVKALTNTLKSMTNRAVETGATNSKELQDAIYTAGSMVTPFMTMQQGKPNSVPLFNPDAKDNQIGGLYGAKINGKTSMIVYLGSDNFIVLD